MAARSEAHRTLEVIEASRGPIDPDELALRITEELRAGMPAADAPAFAERLRRSNGAGDHGPPADFDENRPPPEIATAKPQSDLAWTPLDLEVLAEREPQLPTFIVDDWLPVGYATLFAGHGGVGKSSIALYLAVCIAASKPFFALEVQRKRVLYLSCEDRENVLHWRLARICAHLGVNLASLRGWLHVFDLVGSDALLWERDPRSGHTVTPAQGRLDVTIREHDAEVLMVDGISDTFAGRENDRADVKRYVNALLALLPAERGALLLVGHVAKPTAANAQTGEGYSGSTQWHNAARARWYLYPETEHSEDNDSRQRTGRLLLDLQKSNLGRVDQSIVFNWDESAHLFIGQSSRATSFDTKHRDRQEQLGILRALKACADASPPIVVPAAMTGPRTGYHVLKVQPDFPETLRSGRASTRRFWQQIENMRRLHLCAEDSYRRSDNRHVVRHLVLTAEGVRRCAE